MQHRRKIRGLITLAAALLVVAVGVVALVHLGAVLHPTPAATQSASVPRLIDPADYPQARYGIVQSCDWVGHSPTATNGQRRDCGLPALP
jgi:hypothetical protein